MRREFWGRFDGCQGRRRWGGCSGRGGLLENAYQNQGYPFPKLHAKQVIAWEGTGPTLLVISCSNLEVWRRSWMEPPQVFVRLLRGRTIPKGSVLRSDRILPRNPDRERCRGNETIRNQGDPWRTPRRPRSGNSGWDSPGLGACGDAGSPVLGAAGVTGGGLEGPTDEGAGGA